VRAGPAPPAAAARDVADLAPADEVLARADAERRVGLGSLVGALLAPWVAGFAFAAWRTARARRCRDPVELRARAAAPLFLARARAGGADLRRSFAEYLAARLRCSPSAVVAPELAARLAAAGVPQPLAARAAAMLDELEGARFGRWTPATTGSEASAMVRELEAAFRAVKDVKEVR
jgi:hypothetical protein